MSFDIASVGGVAPLPGPARTEAAAAGSTTAPASAADPVKVDTIPSSPPPEVQAAMSVAAQSYDKLQDSGRGLHFKVDDATGKLIVEVHDLHGNLLFTVPASKALDIAGGGSLEN